MISAWSITRFPNVAPTEAAKIPKQKVIIRSNCIEKRTLFCKNHLSNQAPRKASDALPRPIPAATKGGVFDRQLAAKAARATAKRLRLPKEYKHTMARPAAGQNGDAL